MVKNITFYCLQFEKSTYLCTWLWPMQGLDFLNNNNIDIQILENFLLMKSSNQNIWGALYLVAALLLSASCSEYNPDMSEGNLTKEEYEKVMEFTQNFKLRYGEIAPDNDWGFGELEVKGSRGVKGTRLYADTNSNLWVEYKKRNDGQGDYVWNFYAKDGMTIPGFPSNVNRYYYTEEGIFQSKDELLAYMQKNKIYEIHPIGDVTDEEIIYVSNWFRTHTNLQSLEVNLTNFYIQSISRDHDRVSYPNGAWKTLENQNLTYSLDHLGAIQETGTVVHCNNFNAGNTNPIPEVLPSDTLDLYNNLPSTNGYTGIQGMDFCKFRTIQCMKTGQWDWDKSRVVSFQCLSSDNIDPYRINKNYVLVHLEFTGPKSGLKYSGDYLAFDYSFNKDGKVLEPDGYYSNWIVKISPAYPTPTPDPEYKTETKRVMCEDLGNTYDFDFNDLVFDVYYTYKGTEANKTNITAHITLQAVGGTLPIYIGTDTADPTKELHYRMLGQASSSPINVAASNGATHAPVSFTISAKTTNPNDIDIIVRNPDAKGAITDIILPKSGESNLAPQKICMPVGTRWLKENQQIEWGYTMFKDWVNNGRNTEYDVWTTGIQEDFLYK